MRQRPRLAATRRVEALSGVKLVLIDSVLQASYVRRHFTKTHRTAFGDQISGIRPEGIAGGPLLESRPCVVNSTVTDDGR
jgi:hypothetical protein